MKQKLIAASKKFTIQIIAETGKTARIASAGGKGYAGELLKLQLRDASDNTSTTIEQFRQIIENSGIKFEFEVQDL
jgi:hypothetical protein